MAIGSATQPMKRFSSCFEALTGNTPFPWQEALFREFLAGRIPRNVNLPTGSGKTSTISIWLIALAQQARSDTITLPRRIVWVVNRRVVVDQATDDAINIRKKLRDCSTIPELNWIRNQLHRLRSTEKETIAISTLRGEHEDNKEWSRDPACPAIIIGTVDMIGSRLLFSGYGDGRYWRAQHAGLLGQDALIVNDEAHLTPAFGNLLCSIESIQRGSLRAFRTMRLSATHTEGDCWGESLDADRSDERFRKIFECDKKLFVQAVANGKVERTIVDLASRSGAGRTLVFVTEPEKVSKLAIAIRKKIGGTSGKRLLTLTGTMRGYERDRLVEQPEFQPFLEKARPAEDCWLIATSAGEVGINISSDRLITGADTLEHLIQRFGRLNRFGETEGVAYVVAGNNEKNQRAATAVKVLSEHLVGNEAEGFDISPRALFRFPLNEDACSRQPNVAKLRPWHIDVWSQTSLGRHPARPAVDSWLHGQDREPETYLAWREYIDVLANDELVGNEDLEELLDEYPVLAHERLREPTAKLVKKFQELFRDDNTAKVIRIKPDGSVDIISLPKMRVSSTTIDIREDRNARAAVAELAYTQLILPTGCGRLQDGMFDSRPPTKDQAGSKSQVSLYDLSGAVKRTEEVSGRLVPEMRASYRAVKQQDGTYLMSRFGALPRTNYAPDVISGLTRKDLDRFAAERGLRFLIGIRAIREDSESGSETILLYFRAARKRKSQSDEPVFVGRHNEKVSRLASEIAKAVGLPADETKTLEAAGAHHDLGKGRDIWQRAAGNYDRKTGKRQHDTPIAKPIGIMRGRQLGGFRHELASVLDVKMGLTLAPEPRDLLLHLIACHHGHARPCFQAKTYDREHWIESTDEALETVQRFARLQRKYGAWGLAYIEAVLRAADGIASEETPEQPLNG